MTHDLSQKLFKTAKEVIPGGVNSPVRAFRNVDGEPFFVNRARGCRVWDVDGNEYIDYIGTWGPAILGHAPEIVVETVREYAKRGTSYGIPHPGEVEMAKLICSWVPSVEKVRMVSSGTEATMSCIRLARGFTGRDKIIKFDGNYHGHVDSLLVAAGSGALTHGEPDSGGIPVSLAAETIVVPYNDEEAVRAVFAACGDQVAAIIVEAIPANAGLVPPVPGFVEFLRKITQENGALLIWDEVMTGFRVAKGGAQEIYGLTPDLTAMGKVIGGGLPVGAFGGRADIMDHLAPDGPVYQAGTLSGNPLAVAAGLAQLKELDRQNGWARLEDIGQQFEDSVRDALKMAGKDYTFYRVGSMFCLYFRSGEIRNVNDVMDADMPAFKRFFHHCLNAGVYFAPSPYETGFLSLAHTSQEIDQTAEVITEALRA